MDIDIAKLAFELRAKGLGYDIISEDLYRIYEIALAPSDVSSLVTDYAKNYVTMDSRETRKAIVLMQLEMLTASLQGDLAIGDTKARDKLLQVIDRNIEMFDLKNKDADDPSKIDENTGLEIAKAFEAALVQIGIAGDKFDQARSMFVRQLQLANDGREGTESGNEAGRAESIKAIEQNKSTSNRET